MKKIITLTMIASLLSTNLVFAESPVTIEPISAVGDVQVISTQGDIDSGTQEQIEQAVIVAKQLGYDLKWDTKTKTATFVKDNKHFSATTGSNVYDINGNKIVLDTKASIKNNKMYIPETFKSILSLDVSTDVLNKIFAEVSQTEKDLFNEQLQINEEYKQAYLSTGGNLEDYIYPDFQIGTEIKSILPNTMSIKVYRFQAVASSYTEELYFNYDLKTGNQLSLQQYFGNQYSTYIKENVIQQAEQRQEDYPDKYSYFEEELNNIVIDENTLFYLNDKSQVVVVFPKYAIAAGVYGSQEFIIPSMVQPK